MQQVTVYGLLDPRTKEFRYVGISTDAAVRLRQHIMYVAADTRQAGTAAKRAWLTDLSDQGLEPYLVVLEVVKGRQSALDREKHWIAKLASEGEPLTNREAALGRYHASNSLGSLFLELAAKRGVLGVGEMAAYINDRTGSDYKYQSVSSYINGRTDPKPEFGLAFSRAFDLDYVECSRYSWVFAFNEEPPEDVLTQAQAEMEAGKPLPYKPLPTQP